MPRHSVYLHAGNPDADLVTVVGVTDVEMAEMNVLVSFISPFKTERRMARDLFA